MSASFKCPSCQAVITADVAPGGQVRCPNCQQNMLIPFSVETPLPAVTLSYGAGTGEPPRQGMAIAALVCGILGVVGCWPVGIVGLILGIVALVKAGNQPQRYRGKGMAIAGICTGGLSLLMFPMMIAILLPSLSRARELSKRTVCAANLRGIGQALQIYGKGEPNGMFPEAGANWQQRLLSAGTVSVKMFDCPSNVPGAQTYYYVPGFSTKKDSNQIIAYEDKAIHKGEGGNILYQDGHVAFVKSPQYEAEISSIKLPDGTAWVQPPAP